MRQYEVMVILDPSLDERTVAPSLDTFLNVIRQDGGKIDKVDIWGKRRLAFEIHLLGRFHGIRRDSRIWEHRRAVPAEH